MNKSPSMTVMEAYALGQILRGIELRTGWDVCMNPYEDPCDEGYAYMNGHSDRAIPQWDPSMGGPQPAWWDPELK